MCLCAPLWSLRLTSNDSSNAGCNNILYLSFYYKHPFMKNLFSLLILLCASVGMQAQEQFSVYFDSNKFDLKPKETERLSQWIAANKECKIVAINGYTAGAAPRDFCL
jgi:hypothetical protein